MPTPFMDIAFPDAIARGATGGPGFKTEIVTLASGSEERNRAWALARCEFDVSTGVRTRAQMAAVVSHFLNVAGRAHSFRFKDWGDYDAAEQEMQSVSATVFQIVKRYSIGGFEYVRPITKPKSGTLSVKVSGSPVTPASIDYLTGLVTFDDPPAETPTADFQFDVPVRFDTDKLPVAVQLHDQLIVSQINLIEVRGE